MGKLEEKQKELAKFEKSLKGKTLKELQELEQTLVQDADQNGIELGKLEFDMPEENYFAVADAVRYFLNKETVEWQYTLGLVSMYDFWDPNKRPEKIPYPHLDSILRTLGGMRFTGYNEWSMVVAVNKFFEPLTKAYTDATDVTYDIAMKHDAVLKAMENLGKEKEKAVSIKEKK